MVLSPVRGQRCRFWCSLLLLLYMLIAFAASQGSGSGSIDASAGPTTQTPSVTPADIPDSPEPTDTSTPTGTPEPTTNPEPTDTPIPTATPEPTDTPIPPDTPEPTNTPRPTATPTPMETREPTDTPEPTNIPRSINTPEPMDTPETTEIPDPTGTPKPTDTPALTDTPEPTDTPKPTDTPEPTDTPALTATPIPTDSPKPTDTPEPTDTPGPTDTPEPTNTPEPTSSKTTPPVPTTAAPPNSNAPSTTTPSTAGSSTAPSSAAPTSPPVVEHYNSSTLPPEVDSRVLNGSDLVNVEVTETALANGTTIYSYTIITLSGTTEKVIVLSPATSSPSANDNTAAQSGSSLSDTNRSNKSSGSVGLGAIVGIVVGAFIFVLLLFGFIAARRRRKKKRPSDASTGDILESPAIGKQARLLADTEYRDMATTMPISHSSGGSMADGKRQCMLWEDSVILASRIPGDRIEWGEIISRGAFGEVFRGRYRDHDVAIKMLLPEKRKDMVHIQGFLSEIKLMATMEHPNIVSFIGVAWESLSDLFCVTEFMTGGDLRVLLQDYLTTGVPQGMDACKMQIAYDVAYALTYLHSLQTVVLHRDLKSRNILLTDALRAKITDFGASRILSDVTMTSGVGSSLWMAPEVMMGQHYDEKADVFSLGVVISELDTHELPYSHAKESNSESGQPLPDTVVLGMVSMGKLRVSFSPFMDPDMANFVERCVSVDPHERPTSAEVLYYLQVARRNGQY